MKLSKVNKGALLWKKAKKIIPGGNQLLSKRAEMFLPEYWPSYYTKAKDVYVWDMDNNKLIDMGIMGIGSCVLGYANKYVDSRVKNAINNGSVSSLNCYEEIQLAEKLIKLHPWSNLARFARSGGEACAIAIRIARAYSKKDKVAFCGYHGWHDWYLSSNISDRRNLDGQLLPGLSPVGVPRALKNTSFPFSYGNIEELEKIVYKNKNEVGVVIMEVSRHKEVDMDFLKKVKQITKKIGAVLIFDEISSGFRVSVGGMHLNYGINPDIVILGKALGNGYPISAIIGRRNVMDAAQDTFISSSMWTERIGYVAGLATLEVFETEQVIKYIVNLGNYLKRELSVILDKNKIKSEIVGLPSNPIIVFKDQPQVTKTVYNQEMLKRGYLCSNVIYLSKSHNKQIIDRYLQISNKVLAVISKSLHKNSLQSLLKGPVVDSGFRRLA